VAVTVCDALLSVDASSVLPASEVLPFNNSSSLSTHYLHSFTNYNYKQSAIGICISFIKNNKGPEGY